MRKFVALASCLVALGVGAAVASAKAVGSSNASPVSCSLAVVSTATAPDELVVTINAKNDTRFGWALYAQPGGQVEQGIFATYKGSYGPAGLGTLSGLEASYPSATSFEFVVYAANGPNPDYSQPVGSCSISTS